MGFFSDLKEDLTQAVNELVPDGAQAAGRMAEDRAVKEYVPEETRGEAFRPETAEDLGRMLDHIDLDMTEEAEEEYLEEEGSEAEEYEEEEDPEAEEYLEEEDPEAEEYLEEEAAEAEEYAAEETAEVKEYAEEEAADTEEYAAEEEPDTEAEEEVVQAEAEPKEEAESVQEYPAAVPAKEQYTETLEEALEEVSDDVIEERSEAAETEEIKNTGTKQEEEEVEAIQYADVEMENTAAAQEAADETAVITEGMVIRGDISSKGSLNVIGTVEGNIDILGKLNITGNIEGASKAADVYAEKARINGDIHSASSIKIGQSTVIIGNIYANSAVIAGAVKGDIDVKGPVILDTSAIVMGNIKSKSVQINNGAVIEGLCSQCYADVNPSSFFEDFKKKK